jgi:hypothetical protein
MQCEVCGARRPPQGPCPNCGAPPPGRGGGREWGGGRSGPGPAARGRGPSGANWGGSGQDWGRQGGSGGGWDYEDEDPGMGRQTGRYRRPQSDYADVDLERALVPSMNLSPAEMAAGVPGMPGVPGVPGMPAEEVERLLGVRRPVYIPATGNKRKFRVGSWRVISGVLSIIFVCLASCAGASLLGKKYFDEASKVPTFGSQTPAIDYSSVPVTPVATMGVQGVNGGGVGAKYITSVTTSQHVDASYNPVGPTSHFLANNTVYVVVDVRNAPSGQHTVCINWYLNGQYLQLADSSKLCTLISSADQNVQFDLSYPQAGVGMARIYWDRSASDTSTGPNDPALAATIVFGVFEPATPTIAPRTPTAISNKTPSTTKTPSPSTTKTP